METRTLGDSDLVLSRLGCGSWAIGGGGWEFASGDQDDRDSIAGILKALELGVNWIDTAAVYGMGHSEEVVARALVVQWRRAAVRVYQVRSAMGWRRPDAPCIRPNEHGCTLPSRHVQSPRASGLILSIPGTGATAHGLRYGSLSAPMPGGGRRAARPGRRCREHAGSRPRDP